MLSMVLLLITNICLGNWALALADAEGSVASVPLKRKAKLVAEKVRARAFESFDDIGDCMFWRNCGHHMDVVVPAIDDVDKDTVFCCFADQIGIK